MKVADTVLGRPRKKKKSWILEAHRRKGGDEQEDIGSLLAQKG